MSCVKVIYLPHSPIILSSAACVLSGLNVTLARACCSLIMASVSTLQVSDIAIAVREGTDAVMLSGESAYGKFPYKSVDVMATVAKHTEQSMLSYAVRP